ncbi:MAG: hypothetical protein CVV09_06625 [Gammaproteobacteria bacterium HGW-Gammaproteobacteria-13]|uniref:hypothetical protein n=1 Tax=Pseudomonas sp. 1928-m TaxID=3033804 RepID=UPI000CAC9D20|nr:hypothetical protein [Pseudomonas sp. 1928-m]MDF3196930.1 hypothetical protein [Pseudomonas sp. 1928-m]PKM26160.1 MAG: hypothetical protein CVV09_06625 [Gammaproteobacteria bacterium HGW-Gammaproteobacteria-13]
MDISVGALVEDIKSAVKGVLKTDIESVRGFSERQLVAIAKQSALVAGCIASGEIKEDEKDFFLDSIEIMVKNFVNTLRGLMMIVVEKVWNAIVGVIWKALDVAIGTVLFISPMALV